MKVYRWDGLVCAALIAAAIVWRHSSTGMPLIITLYWICLAAWMLYVSLSAAGNEKYRKRQTLLRRIYRERFGKLSGLVSWLPLVLILAAGALAFIFPATDLLRTVLLILVFGAAIAAVWLFVWVQRELRKRGSEPDDETSNGNNRRSAP